jgi:hypothetical protein
MTFVLLSMVILPGAGILRGQPDSATPPDTQPSLSPAVEQTKGLERGDVLSVYAQLTERADRLKSTEAQINAEIQKIRSDQLVDSARILDELQRQSNIVQLEEARLADRIAEMSAYMNQFRFRHFVAVVVDTKGITFQGKPIMLDQLHDALMQVTDRVHTVVQLSYASDDVTMGQFNQVQTVVGHLVQQLGFEYLSFTGRHPANSKGSPDEKIIAPGNPQNYTVLPYLTPAPPEKLTHVLKVELRRAQFLDGDSIQITEVRSDKPDFEVDGTYQITGTYTLASHDQATLSISCTAKDPKNGWGNMGDAERSKILRGSGTFTVTERMSCEGFPHLTLSAQDGNFGDVYFGSGEWLAK